MVLWPVSVGCSIVISSIEIVQLSGSSDGASFSDKWSTAPVDGQTVDVTAEAEGPANGKELHPSKD